MFPIETALTALCTEKKNCWAVDLFAVEEVA